MFLPIVLIHHSLILLSSYVLLTLHNVYTDELSVETRGRRLCRRGPFSAATRKSPHLFKYLLFAAIHSMSVFVVFIVLVEGNLLIISSEGNLLTWAQLDFLLATDQNAIA